MSNKSFKHVRRRQPLWVKRPMAGLAETARVLYGEPVLSNHRSKKLSNHSTNSSANHSVNGAARKRRRGSFSTSTHLKHDTETGAKPKLQRSKTESRKLSAGWGLPDAQLTNEDDGKTEMHTVSSTSFNFDVESFMDTREDGKLIDAIALREDYVSRLRDMTAPFLEIDPSKRKIVDSSFFDLQELVDILDLFRFVTIEVIEGIMSWRKRKSKLCNCQSQSRNGDLIHACGGASPYIWHGQNYLLKIPSDLQFLSRVPTVMNHFGFTFARNPFVLPEALSPFSYSKEIRSKNDVDTEHRYTPPSLDMRRIRTCADIILAEEEIHGKQVTAGTSELDELNIAEQANLEVEWSNRIAKQVMPKLAAIIVSGNLRLCFERQDVDGDGYLSYHEFHRAILRMGQFKLDSQDELDWLLIKLDREDARCVTYQAFQDLVERAKSGKVKRVRSSATRARHQAREIHLAKHMDLDHSPSKQGCNKIPKNKRTDQRSQYSKHGNNRQGKASARNQDEYDLFHAQSLKHRNEQTEKLKKRLDPLLQSREKLNKRISELKEQLNCDELDEESIEFVADRKALENSYGARVAPTYSHPRRLHIEYPKLRLKSIHKKRKNMEDLLYEFQASLRSIEPTIASLEAKILQLNRMEQLRQEAIQLEERKEAQRKIDQVERELADKLAMERKHIHDKKRKQAARDAAIYREHARQQRRLERRRARDEVSILKSKAAIQIQAMIRSYLARMVLCPAKRRQNKQRLAKERRAMFQEELEMQDFLTREANKVKLREFIQTKVLGGCEPFGAEARPTPVIIFVVNVPGSERAVRYFSAQLQKVLPGYFQETAFSLKAPSYTDNEVSDDSSLLTLQNLQAKLNTSAGLVIHIRAPNNEFGVSTARRALIRSIRPLMATIEPFPVCVLADFSMKSHEPSEISSGLPSVLSGENPKALEFQNHFDKQTVDTVIETFTGSSSKALLMELTRSAKQSHPVASFLLLLRMLRIVVRHGVSDKCGNSTPHIPLAVPSTETLLSEWNELDKTFLLHPEALIDQMKSVSSEKCLNGDLLKSLNSYICDPRWPLPSYRQRPALSLIRDWLVALFELTAFDPSSSAAAELRASTPDLWAVEVANDGSKFKVKTQGYERRSASESKQNTVQYHGALQRLTSTKNMASSHNLQQTTSTDDSTGGHVESGVSVWQAKGGGVFDVRLSLVPSVEVRGLLQRHVDVVVHLSLRTLLVHRSLAKCGDRDDALVTIYRYGNCLLVCEFDRMHKSQAYLCMDETQLLEAFVCKANQPKGKLFHFQSTEQFYDNLISLLHRSGGGVDRHSGKHTRARLNVCNIGAKTDVSNLDGYFTRNLSELEETDAVVSCGMCISGHDCLVEISHDFAQSMYQILVCDLDTLQESSLQVPVRKVDTVTPQQLRGTIEVFELMLSALSFKSDRSVRHGLESQLEFALDLYESVALKKVKDYRYAQGPTKQSGEQSSNMDNSSNTLGELQSYSTVTNITTEQRQTKRQDRGSSPEARSSVGGKIDCDPATSLAELGIGRTKVPDILSSAEIEPKFDYGKPMDSLQRDAHNLPLNEKTDEAHEQKLPSINKSKDPCDTNYLHIPIGSQHSLTRKRDMSSNTIVPALPTAGLQQAPIVCVVTPREIQTNTTPRVLSPLAHVAYTVNRNEQLTTPRILITPRELTPRELGL